MRKGRRKCRFKWIVRFAGLVAASISAAAAGTRAAAWGTARGAVAELVEALVAGAAAAAHEVAGLPPRPPPRIPGRHQCSNGYRTKKQFSVYRYRTNTITATGLSLFDFGYSGSYVSDRLSKTVGLKMQIFSVWCLLKWPVNNFNKRFYLNRENSCFAVVSW